MNKPTSIIEIKDLIKKYKKSETNAVDNISLRVSEGEFFALLGPNGAGKTTTISILNSTLAKTSGEVMIAGFDVDKNPSEVRRNIGVIFQNPSLDLNLTAEENIRFHANLYGLYIYTPLYSLMDKHYKHKVEHLAHVIGISMEELFKPVKTFSGGMKRKLEIIRGLMHNPKVLFLDEPTTGLDPVSRKNLWVYLKEIREKENITIFLTTHYLDEAEGADHVCVINHGKIISEGSPRHIKEKLIDEFLVIDSHHQTELAAELKQKQIAFAGDGPFRIGIKHNHEVQDILKNLQTHLSSIKINSPTLEEAYINLIEKGSDDKDKK